MLGGIYSEENCPLCGARMQDNHRDAVACPNPKHRNQKARNLIIRFGRKFFKRSTNYEHACRILTGVRFKTDEGTYDPRDYQASNPLSVELQIEKYAEVKRKTLKAGTYRSIGSHIKRISVHFGPANVKTVGYADIEDFLFAQEGISEKTRHNLCSVLRDFFGWLVKRKILRKEQIPEFPEIKFELGTRKIIDKQTQTEILEEVKRSTKNPRIYIGILWCSTYINTRPGELLDILEEDIDLDRGIILIRKHKTDRSTSDIKIIPLWSEDIDLIKTLPKGFPKLPFFRRASGKRLGKNAFYDAWKKACSNLGIEGVDLYGGTRHSSATAMRRELSFEDVKGMTGHTTNTAFTRYFQKDLEVLRDRYAMTRQCTTDAPPNSGVVEGGKLRPIKD